MAVGGDAHKMSEGVGFHDDPQAAAVIFSGVLGTIVLVIAVLALQALTYQYEGIESERKNSNQRWAAYAEQVNQQQEALNSYRWVDREKKVVGIPIDRAIDLVAKEYGGQSR